MQRYTKHIKDALDKLSIKSSYDSKKKLFYGLSESLFGDVYCIYYLENDILRCLALFEPEILHDTKKTVRPYLEELNKVAGGGCFHIDNALSRVSFSVDYKLSEGLNTLDFDAFCTFWYYRFKNQRQILYWMITGNMSKNWDMKLS